MKRITTIEEIKRAGETIKYRIADYTKKEQRLYGYSNEALCNFLRKTDRILSGRMIKVKPHISYYEDIYINKIENNACTIEGLIKHMENEPTAYTDKRNITINFTKLWVLSEYNINRFIPIVKAMNFHEFSHSLYTILDMEKDVLPYATKHGIDCNLMKNIVNWLEDMRIETIFTKIYPKSTRYFTVAVLSFVKHFKWGWTFTYGRKYLPKKIRDMHIKHMDDAPEETKVFNPHFKEVAILIDEYIVCMDKNRMLDIAREIIHLLPENKDMLPCYSSLGMQSYSKSASIKSNKRKEKMVEGNNKIKDAMKKLKRQIKQEEQEVTEMEKESNDVEGENEGDEEATKNSDVAEKNAGEEEGGDINNGDDITAGNDNDEKNEENIENAEIKKAIEKEIDEKVGEMENEIINDQNTVKAIDGKTFPYNPKAIKIGNKLALIIEKLRNDMGAAYTSNERSGRINIRQAMLANKTGKTRIFDKYHPSKVNKTRMAVVLHVDKSGSMSSGGALGKAMATAKALTYGFDKVGCKTKIYAFDAGGYLIKDWNNKEFPKLASCGGTSPIANLISAVKDFEYAKKRWGIDTFVNIIITDGAWKEDYFVSEENEITGSMVIRLMNKMGVNTVEIYINNGYESESGHGHGSKTFRVINSIDELPSCMEKIVRNISNELRKKYRRR